MSGSNSFVPTTVHWVGLGVTVLLATALFAAGISAGWPSDEVLEQMAAPPTPDDTIQVAVPRHEIPAGQPIRDSDLELVWIHPDFVPAVAIRTMREAAGRRPNTRLLRGEFLRPERFQHPDPPELTEPEAPEAAP